MNMQELLATIRQGMVSAKKLKEQLYLSASESVEEDEDDYYLDKIKIMNAVYKKMAEAEMLMLTAVSSEPQSAEPLILPEELDELEETEDLPHVYITVSEGSINQSLINFREVVSQGMAAVGDTIEVSVPFRLRNGTSCLTTEICGNYCLRSRQITPRLCKFNGLKADDVICITKLGEGKFRISVPNGII